MTILALLPVAAAALNTAAPPKQALAAIFSKPNDDTVLADPILKRPLRSELTVLAGVRKARQISESGAAYPVNSVYADLLPTSGRSEPLSIEELQTELQEVFATRVQTGLFRSPLTAFLYERGWRQNFANAGFPGIEKEFVEVSEWFAPATEGVVVDMSCGSGLMTRRLVSSGAYGRVLALDYSEAMLRETARRVREEKVPTDALTLCRADVAALPLQPASVDALHAGAAMHCWPRLEEGLAEIRACLKVCAPDVLRRSSWSHAYRPCYELRSLCPVCSGLSRALPDLVRPRVSSRAAASF